VNELFRHRCNKRGDTVHFVVFGFKAEIDQIELYSAELSDIHSSKNLGLSTKSHKSKSTLSALKR
jgi:hypothetical protein